NNRGLLFFWRYDLGTLRYFYGSRLFVKLHRWKRLNAFGQTCEGEGEIPNKALFIRCDQRELLRFPRSQIATINTVGLRPFGKFPFGNYDLCKVWNLRPHENLVAEVGSTVP